MKDGKFNGKKLRKTCSVKDKNRGGKTGITSIIYRALEKLGACSVSDLATYIWESDKEGIATDHFKSLQVFNRFVAKVLKKMYARGKITCLRFRTIKGRIYGISTEACWRYLFEKGIAPERLIKTIYFLIGQQGFVTNVELKELGFPASQIKLWIDKKLVNEGAYLMMYRVNENIKVYFPPQLRGQLENYLKSEQFAEIYSKYVYKRTFSHELGKLLEKITEELYKKMGYEYRSQFPVFDYHVNEETGKEEKKLIAVLDGLAFKKIEEGNSPNDLIIVECKNVEKPISFHKIFHLIFIRNNKFKGRGEIHVIALNGATQSVWKNIRFYPFIRIIGYKQFVELCEKYKPETYVMLKRKFGGLREAIKVMTKEFYVNGRLVSYEEMRRMKGDKI